MACAVICDVSLQLGAFLQRFIKVLTAHPGALESQELSIRYRIKRHIRYVRYLRRNLRLKGEMVTYSTTAHLLYNNWPTYTRSLTSSFPLQNSRYYFGSLPKEKLFYLYVLVRSISASLPRCYFIDFINDSNFIIASQRRSTINE